jgi:7-cyano-7-deazaguanine reductase
MSKSFHSVDFVLGKNTTNYKLDSYSPDVLARELRQDNRTAYGIKEDNLPFVGFDIWHAYEISTMTKKGLPVNGILKIKVPSSSKYIVESKSFKLYLFSFNYERLGKTSEEAIAKLTEIIEKDISELVESPVEAHIFYGDANKLNKSTNKFTETYVDIGTFVDLDSLKFTKFQESRALLKKGESQLFKVSSDLLKSNCKITHQADYGDIYIYFRGDKKGVDLGSLAKYIVSFRKENHFHEEIVECIYTSLLNKFKPKELLVTAFYTRRGGLDICPIRATSADIIPESFGDVTVLDTKTLRQ